MADRLGVDRLGIVAGGGRLPALLISACRGVRRDVFVVALSGHAEPELLTDVAGGWVRLGAAATALRMLRDNGVTELVIAGRVKRPTLAELRPDARMAKFFAKIGAAMFRDGALMSAVTKALEDEGFRMVAPEDVLASLLAGSGPYGRVRPDSVATADIARGIEVALAIGAMDVGQAAVVQQGMVLGMEAAEGTSALVARCQALARPGLGGVLVKVAKPGQDRRIDLPTIGPDTVDAAVAGGLRGIAVEAGGALIVDRDRLIEKADAAGLFVVGVTVPKG